MPLAKIALMIEQVNEGVCVREGERMFDRIRDENPFSMSLKKIALIYMQ